MILGIDTSIGTAVAVVGDDGDVLAEIAGTDRLGHAERIGTMIEQALAGAGVAPSDITAVAAGMGPGPFTGLRVGIAAARAFALARGIPVVPVVSHDAAALTHAETIAGQPGRVDARGAETATDAASRPFAVITDARRREVAVSIYAVSDGAPQRIAAPALHAKGPDVPVDDLALSTPAGDQVDRVEVTAISAAALARLAAQRLVDGTTDAAASEPLYLRSPDVTVSSGPKRVTA